MYHRLQYSGILCCAHNAFMYFVWILEQTAICLYTELTCRFYNRGRKCLLCGTDWVFKSDRYKFDVILTVHRR